MASRERQRKRYLAGIVPAVDASLGHGSRTGRRVLGELRTLYPGDPATPRATLEHQLATVRRRGYATNLGESERGIAAVGACVRNTSRRAVAALAVAMPSARCPRARLPDLAAAVIDVATTASRTLHSI